VPQRAVPWEWHIELWLGSATASCALGVAQRAVPWEWHSELWLGSGTASCGLGVSRLRALSIQKVTASSQAHF
jgi:hypothetical protein